MSQSGIQPRQIISSLQLENPGLRAVSYTVYNAKAKIHKEKLGGRTMIEVLIQELGQGGFIYDVEHDTSSTITHLFLIHPISITMVKNFSSIFIMDCTHKTNKYKMPLFNIIGVSCFNKTFYARFAFLKNEKEDDFLWALSKFKKVLDEENQHSVIISDRCQAFIMR
ncbi:protein FAR1-RELATED SEQUENCE 5-like [Carex rostrata]